VKFLLYNIYEGCQEEDRFKLLLDFVKNEEADNVCLLELNKWDKNKIYRFCNYTNLNNYIFVNSNKGYHLGFFTKKKIIDAKAWHKEFNHAAAYVTISHKKKTYKIIFTHLTPQGPGKRIHEVTKIIKYNKPIKKRTLLLGDLNTLSPEDNYARSKLVEELKKKKVTKFGITKLDWKVMRELRKYFIDPFLPNKEVRYTVPTKFNKDKNHCTKLRLDYVLVSKDLKNKISNQAIVINDQTDAISDHYPIVFTLKTK